MAILVSGAKSLVGKALAEFFAMMLFVYVGVGTAMTPTRTVVQIAFAFGMAIVILAYSIGNKSGGHINCAVTTALMVAGKTPLVEGFVIIGAQLLGSVAGAGLLAGTIPGTEDASICFGTNSVAPGFGKGNAFCGEFVMTFVLLYVVFHTAIHKRHRIKTDNAAALAIGMAVFCAHAVLIPIDGCSINPTRTLGPAIVASIRGLKNSECHQWQDIWIFIVAPEAAAVVCGVLWRCIWSRDEDVEPGHAEDFGRHPAAPVDAAPTPDATLETTASGAKRSPRAVARKPRHDVDEADPDKTM